MTAALRSSLRHKRVLRLVRQRYAAQLDELVPRLAAQIQATLIEAPRNVPREIDSVLMATDAQRKFHLAQAAWVRDVRNDWQFALSQSLQVYATQPAPLLANSFSLLDDEVVEQSILASRLSLGVLDKAQQEFNDLRLRIQHLDQVDELPADDLFQPDRFTRILIAVWVRCGLSRPMWGLVHDPVRNALTSGLLDAYAQANALLASEGILPQIELKSLVKRSPAHVRAGEENTAPGRLSGLDAGPLSGPGAFITPVRPSTLERAATETRLLTNSTPLLRARVRAQGVMGQLRRFLSDRTGEQDIDHNPPPSASLQQAIRQVSGTAYDSTHMMGALPATDEGAVTQQDVERSALRVRQQSVELQSHAETPSEKAIIEIVAMMFQAILAEERIPATVRVWFARLQMPVLRLALTEPDFFASPEHPARQLIDRMGSTAMGFDQVGAGSPNLEREIKRIVQVIEQYPETGRRVYELTLEEFKKFLGQSLTEGPVVQIATLAQQIEQKDALTVQYTIELRKMLATVPVDDHVREFLFGVWSEVLAMAAVRHGGQNAETLRYKQVAADLLWAVSAKPNRVERARVMQELPKLLQGLRDGMGTLGLNESAQDDHIKSLREAVAEAFMARTESLSQEQLEELARGLVSLEQIVPNDNQGEVMLDPETIEMIAGIDASTLTVLNTGGTEPSPGMLAWAAELNLGAWFRLEHEHSVLTVQYVWRSQRGQLHLFAPGHGRSYLLQTQRLAAYLQAGLLVPLEDEALTVRATREAIDRLQNNQTDLDL